MMNRSIPSPRLALWVILAVGVCGSCSAGGTGDADEVASPARDRAGNGGAAGAGGRVGNVVSAGGAPIEGESGGGVGGMTGGAGGETGNAPADSGAGSSGRAGAGSGGSAAGAAGASAADGGIHNCSLPATVSFQKDVQPFLVTSCGGGNGCHVIDGVSTMGSGGFNHAYDWLTAGAHTFSCPTAPKRFEVVIAVINAANPPTCSKSRKMPPPDVTGAGLRTPLTACQVATLQTWLDEPLVTQTHRADDTSPTTPYPMPPFN